MYTKTSTQNQNFPHIRKKLLISFKSSLIIFLVIKNPEVCGKAVEMGQISNII
jgi:hypothetical protein